MLSYNMSNLFVENKDMNLLLFIYLNIMQRDWIGEARFRILNNRSKQPCKALQRKDQASTLT
jgi:hypothetical protein